MENPQANSPGNHNLDLFLRVARRKTAFDPATDVDIWSALLQWLRARGMYIQCAIVLEKMHRYREALDLVKALGSANYYEVFKNDGTFDTGYTKADGTVVGDTGAVKRGGIIIPNCEVLPPWPELQKQLFERKLQELTGLAKALEELGANNKGGTATELEQKYAYGEISKEEYDRLRPHGSSSSTRTCAACRHALNADDKFCPQCGVKTADT